MQETISQIKNTVFGFEKKGTEEGTATEKSRYATSENEMCKSAARV